MLIVSCTRTEANHRYLSFRTGYLVLWGLGLFAMTGGIGWALAVLTMCVMRPDKDRG